MIQFSSVTQSCPTLCNPMNCSTSGLPVHHPSWSPWTQESTPWTQTMSIESVMPSNHLILCCPLLLPSIFLSISVFFQWIGFRIRWPKYWNFSFSISPSSEYSRLISFRMDWLDLLQSKELSRVFSNTTVQKHQFFGTQLSLWYSSQIRTWLLEKP